MEIAVCNRQRLVRFDLNWLQTFATNSLTDVLKESADNRFALKKIRLVEVAIVSDRTIARIHRDFMGIRGTTDVITFEHGEIITSAQTACIQAKLHGHSIEEELGLYIIHGLLHLNGFNDLTPPDFRRMHQVQNRIWKAQRKCHPLSTRVKRL